MYYAGKLGFGSEIETFYPKMGPAQFVGNFYTPSKKLATSFGPYIIAKDFQVKRPLYFTNLEELNRAIWSSFEFAPIDDSQNVYEFLKNIARKFKIKVLSEGYDAIVFKNNPRFIQDCEAETVVPLYLNKGVF